MKSSFILTASLLMTLLASGMAWALSDPTRPQNYQPSEAQGGSAALGAGTVADEEAEVTYALQYVLVSKQRKYAVINGSRVLEGDRIGDARVLRIQPGSVKIRVSGVVQDLNLGFTDIKKSQGRSSR